MGIKLDKFYNSEYYRISMYNFQIGIAVPEVVGYLTQPISMSLSSNYEPLIEQSASHVLGNAALGTFFNRSTVVQTFSALAWQGVSEAPLFTFSFGWLATNSTQTQVIDPSKALLQWIVPPRTSLGVMIPPATLKNNCEVVIEGWLDIDNLMPIDCQVDYDKVFDRYDGSPLKAEVTMTFQYHMAPTAEEVEQWFM